MFKRLKTSNNDVFDAFPLVLVLKKSKNYHFGDFWAFLEVRKLPKIPPKTQFFAHNWSKIEKFLGEPIYKLKA